MRVMVPLSCAILVAACDYPRTAPAIGEVDAPPGEIDAPNGVGSILADVTTLPFGQVDLAVRSELDVTLRNTGTAPVMFSAPTITGDAAFTLASNLCVGTLAPNTNCVIEVAATPAATGDAAGVLNVPTEVGTIVVDLTVTGAALVTVTVAGPGRVTSSPAGIDCGGGVGVDCMYRFTVGSVALTSDVDTTVRWTGACLGNGDCALTLDAARTVTATTFAPMRRTYNDDDNGYDACHAIAAGPGDSIVVAGEVQSVIQGYNAWARAYDAAGGVLWSREIVTPSEGQDRGFDVVAAPDGTTAIAGKWYSGSNTRQNYFLTKLTAAGTPAAGGDSSSIVNDDMYYGIARDSTGALIVTGFFPDAGGVAQAWVRKFAATGTSQLWAVVRNGSAGGSDAANKVAVDSADNVIAVGYEANSGAGRDGWIAKYALNGAQLWSVPVASAGTGADDVLDVAVGSDDNIVVVAKLDASSSIRAYTAAGAPRWDVTSADTIMWRAVAVDGARNVVVTGNLGSDLIVRKYSPAGVFLWQRAVAGATGNGVAADSQGNVLVCGDESVAGNKTNVLLVKYYQ